MNRERKGNIKRIRLRHRMGAILLFVAGMVLGILSFILAYQASPSGEPVQYIYENF